MADVVITEFMDDDAVNRIKTIHDTIYDPKLVDQDAELFTQAQKAKCLIVRNRTQVRDELLTAAVNLSCVGRLGVGLDNIDVEGCKARGIEVFPATGANDLSVAEYVITATLMLLRGAWLNSAEVAEGSWPRQQMIGREMAGKTLGLIGFGSIAQQTAWRAHMMGMQIVAYDPYLLANHEAWQLARNVSIDGVFASADVISIHTPLTDNTRQMINQDAISSMKDGAILINAARGGVLDDTAVAAGLKSGKLGGAALDVFESEPLNAEAGAMFKDIPNVLLTPHIAGVTEESNVRVSHLIADKILAHLGQE